VQVVELDIPQVTQCGVIMPDPVELGDVRRDRAPGLGSPGSKAAQSRGRYWYFSLSRYSSLPARTATCSQSSYPEYIPHDGDSVVASTARSRNAPGPPYCRNSWRMSGVLGQKFGLM